jgi:hypothetical protein
MRKHSSFLGKGINYDPTEFCSISQCASESCAKN